MKVKHIIAIFVIGIVLLVIGACFKINHWLFANELLISGSILKVIAGILFIWKILTTDKFKEFLNS